MRLRRLIVRGLPADAVLLSPSERPRVAPRRADAVTVDAEDGPVFTLPAAPEGARLSEALRVAVAALAPATASRHLAQVGWCAPLGLERVGSKAGADAQEEAAFTDLDSTWQGLDPRGVRALVEPGSALEVTLTLLPDPLLYREVRERAPRTPHLAMALAAGEPLEVRVGVLPDRSRTAAAPHLHALRVGDEAIPVAEAERPGWVAPVLAQVGARLAWLDPAQLAASAERLARAMWSHDPELRAHAMSAAAALAGPPFALGAFAPVLPDPTADLEHVVAAFGPTLEPARRFGRAAEEALELVVAALLDRPDALVVQGPSAAALRWLAERATGEDAALEQVIVIPAADGGAP